MTRTQIIEISHQLSYLDDSSPGIHHSYMQLWQHTRVRGVSLGFDREAQFVWCVMLETRVQLPASVYLTVRISCLLKNAKTHAIKLYTQILKINYISFTKLFYYYYYYNTYTIVFLFYPLKTQTAYWVSEKNSLKFPPKYAVNTCSSFIHFLKILRCSINLKHSNACGSIYAMRSLSNLVAFIIRILQIHAINLK